MASRYGKEEKLMKNKKKKRSNKKRLIPDESEIITAAPCVKRSGNNP
jgi:hypothetical protein